MLFLKTFKNNNPVKNVSMLMECFCHANDACYDDWDVHVSVLVGVTAASAVVAG